MDHRLTFASLDELKNIVSGIQQSKTKASLLLDRAGLTRMEGTITDVEEDKTAPDRTAFRITGGERIALNEVIAINGIFRSDYSEC
ncbi:hypothetical protein EPD60_16255 [Flaviaesturariibacter flavus]|uniref:Uncharacterized protein n=1 Tax=Flaviaesturariibacter flavus TaxID=2502780 RepID=A0A4R1B7B6_9BACT|nr:hypothetical protein [Flaviaesturariibacter flavus]TCJ12105.1 hypothetical protein EPD60_16255 [Flaviaesturariibacter flavus]